MSSYEINVDDLFSVCMYDEYAWSLFPLFKNCSVRSPSRGLGLITDVMERSGYEPLISIKFENYAIKTNVSKFKEGYFSHIIVPDDFFNSFNHSKSEIWMYVKRFYSLDEDSQCLILKEYEQQKEKMQEQEYENCARIERERLNSVKLEWKQMMKQKLITTSQLEEEKRKWGQIERKWLEQIELEYPRKLECLSRFLYVSKLVYPNDLVYPNPNKLELFKRVWQELEEPEVNLKRQQKREQLERELMELGREFLE